MKVKRSNEVLTEGKVKKSVSRKRAKGVPERLKPDHFVRSYHYSYSRSGPDAEELEERVIIDNDKGRIKTRKNDRVEERDMTEKEIKDYNCYQSEFLDRSWSNLLSWRDPWTDPWFQPLLAPERVDQPRISGSSANLR